ncbi:MAG: hypothetical protein QOH10_1795, partial [Actinomycetota bacterium]|nr:hypothetical protein [Actinomycetota bacterium]
MGTSYRIFAAVGAAVMLLAAGGGVGLRSGSAQAGLTP